MLSLSNITNYKHVGDWFYIVTATILVDFVTIALAKYPGKDPYFKVNALNDWYTKFGAVAVASDVASILIGIAVARYIYTSMGLTNPLWFIPILLLFQLFHDLFFYVAVITPIPKGHNQMIDVFKAYGQENGQKILGADALLMLSSVLVASVLKSSPDHVTSATLLVSIYAITYILYTKGG